MTKRTWQTVVVGGVLAMVALGNIVFLHDAFTTRFPGGNDSIPRWVGSQAWFFEGLNPYNAEVTDRAQQMIYGRLAHADEDKQRFVYPFYTVFFYLPLIWLNYEWARAVGMVILEASLLLTVIVSLRLYQWKPPLWLLALTVMWPVVFYHGARTIILWQLAGVVAVLIAVGLWGIKEQRDVLAGVCLALASVKPQMAFLILPLIGLWSLATRRWKLAASLTVSLSVLVGVSFLLLPSWLSDMRLQLADYTNYTHIGSPLNILTQIVFPALGQPVEWVFIGALMIWLLWEWWLAWKRDSERLDWALALTLVITNVVVTRTATTNYVMMLPVLIYLFAAVAQRFGPKANLGIALAEVVLLVGLWALFAATVQGREEQWPVYLPWPLFLLVGLIIFRPKLPRPGSAD